MPIQYRVNTQLTNLQSFAKKINLQIGKTTTWRINLRRRHTQLSRDEIIKVVAEEISNGKVKLTDPQYYLVIEIIGKWTYFGLSPIPELAIINYQDDDYQDEFTF